MNLSLKRLHMTRRQAKTILDRFANPAGLSLLISLLLLVINAYASSQLLPVAGNLQLLDQRLTTVERALQDQQLIIIPKGELDAKFDNINNQLHDIKEALKAR